MLTPSKRGELIASRAAISARSEPSAVAEPIIAAPPSVIVVRTSAKSKLIRPGIRIKSLIPRVALYNTSLAMANASTKEVDSSPMSKRRSFGMTMTVSHCFFNSEIPSKAYFFRIRPSHSKGVVTIPTVKMPLRFAIPATTGAPPVPVPPPIPAVTNIISALSMVSSISCRFSSTASLPTSGRAPAPKPLVRAVPTCTLISAKLFLSAWASVFRAMYSTLSKPMFIMLLMAFPPPPPTPITLILAFS